MNNLRNGVLFAVLAIPLTMPAQTPALPPQRSAAIEIDAAIAAMGGEAVLTRLQSLTLESIGHAWALEQSERPEGPWLSSYQQTTEVRDFDGRRRWVQSQQRNWSFPQWSTPFALVVADGVAARTNGQRWVAGGAGDVKDSSAALALAPERLLFTARDAPDLRRLPDETHLGVVQHVAAFSREGQRLRLFLNTSTRLPTMLEVVRNDQFEIWGDVTERRWFGFWTLEAGGLMYPRQTTTEWNGLPFSDHTVQVLKVNASVDASKFAIPDDVKATFAQGASRPSGMSSLTVDEGRVTAITDWVVQVPGGFNVAFVRQPDGVVILEATTSSAYSQAVLALAAKRFPGAPIKAVVTTSDAWPHVGGIREYVARGIPIYALDLNVAILTRLVKAPHTFAPDALSKSPRAPVFRPVGARLTIGSGETRLDLIPVRGETGERMMIAWLPGARLLYSSDLIQRGRPGTDTFFMPAMLDEVATTVRREKIDGIERVFGMHLTPTPWADVLSAIAGAKGGS